MVLMDDLEELDREQAQKIQKTVIHEVILSGDEAAALKEYFPITKIDMREPENLNTGLHLAVENNMLEVVKKLVKKKADVNMENRFGYTPMHLAASKGFTEIVTALLEYCPDLFHANNAKGYTALHLAIIYDNPEIVGMLMKVGDDPYDKTKDDENAFELAERMGRDDIVRILKEEWIDNTERGKRKRAHMMECFDNLMRRK
ncbi:MAG: hypothetical protein ACD_39C01219G0002 [uncultured bacterium]|nr:MAG: hypothetical protein ACD_39C01219G0002 [uncultured bacterium]